MKHAIETAFREYYDGIGGALADAMQSKEPREKQMGQALAHLEYENLRRALDLALSAQVSILNPYKALSFYLDAQQDHTRGLTLGQMTLAGLDKYPQASLQGQLGAEFVGVIDDIAKRFLLQKQYADAEAAYQRALSLHLGLTIFEEKQKATLGAGLYHQLGMVAQEQRQLAQAERYYQQALQIFIEFNDRYEQAGTYHQLGEVAQDQRQWAQAEHYYQQALQILIECNDRYEQAKIYHKLGMVAQNRRQWMQAESYYKQTLQIYVDFNEQYGQADTYGQLGNLAQEQRQWAQAERYYQQALQLFVEFDDRYSQAGTYHQLGLLAEAQKQWAQARDYLLHALEIFAEFRDEHSIGIALSNLARLQIEGGDATLAAAVAKVLGVSEEEARERLQRTGSD